jgi:hypothetical protein
MQAGNLVEVNAVAPAELLRLIDPAKCTLVRVRESSVLFRPLLQFVSRTAQNSFEIDQVGAVHFFGCDMFVCLFVCFFFFSLTPFRRQFVAKKRRALTL